MKIVHVTYSHTGNRYIDFSYDKHFLCYLINFADYNDYEWISYDLPNNNLFRTSVFNIINSIEFKHLIDSKIGEGWKFSFCPKVKEILFNDELDLHLKDL